MAPKAGKACPALGLGYEYNCLEKQHINRLKSLRYSISVLSIVPQEINWGYLFLMRTTLWVQGGDYTGGIIDKTKMCDTASRKIWHDNLKWE